MRRGQPAARLRCGPLPRRLLLRVNPFSFLVMLTLCWAAPAVAQVARVPVQPMAPGKPDRTFVPTRIYTDACVNASRIAAAEVMDHRHIDLVMKGGERVRLILQNDCNQLTFYGGFYYSQAQAGMICAGRDRLMGRAGGACRVRAIARLKARP